MKITIITGPFYGVPPAPCGAVERLWQDLAQQFAASGHDVAIVCKRGEGQSAEEQVDGVRYIRRPGQSRGKWFPLNLLKDLWYSLRLLPWMPRADVLITNAFWMPPLAGIFRPGAGRIVVNVNRFPKRQMWLYRSAARFASVSTAIRKEFSVQLPSRAHLVRVFPNPIDTAVFKPPVSGSGRSWTQLERTILYTGRVHPEKGLDLLLRAFRQVHQFLPNSRLKIVGPMEVNQGGGGTEYVDLLKTLAIGLPVELCGPIYDRRELCAVLQEAHIYVYPSVAEKGEALPVAPLEAMATGLVPIVSDITCFDDYVFEGRTGYRFDYRGDSAVTNLASVLIKVLSADSSEAVQVGANAAQTALKFSNRNVADAYLLDFEQLVGSGRGLTTV